MKAREYINGYRLLGDFTVVGAGLSKWAFAERGGREYFIKEFLAPTYPMDGSAGSERVKAAKRSRCEAFENHHRRIMEATRRVSGPGGNLIVAVDFFRWGAKYYKITEKIDVAGLTSSDVAGLPLEQRLIIMKSLAHSLKILHDAGIVHCDLKPDNAPIKKTERAYTAKLIDFDSSFFEGEVPSAEEIVGTPEYYSPELLRYIQTEGDSASPRRSSDIFTLGLMFSQYLTGILPRFDVDEYVYPSVAVLSGGTLVVDSAILPEGLVDLIEQMLVLESAVRPSISEVHSRLLARPGRARAAAAVSPVARGGLRVGRFATGTTSLVPTARGSMLKGKGLRGRGIDPPGGTPRLKGKLVRREDEAPG